jgi:hypothetical protein
MKHFFTSALLLIALCITSEAQENKFRDTSLSFEERVESLISILTPEEKVGLMMTRPYQSTDSESRHTTGGARHATAS